MTVAEAQTGLPSTPCTIGSRNFWTAYGWEEGGDEWSGPWGSGAGMWWGSIWPRIRSALPAARVLEIGCGFGRVTNFLRAHTGQLVSVDVTPRCVEHCRRRFDGDARVRCEVTDGRSLSMVESGSIDFAISWEVLVHVERETLAAYFGELARVLRAGGRGFIHHSNLGVHERELAGIEPDERTGGRRLSQTAELCAMDARRAGLRVVSQEILSFNESGLWSDVFTVVERDELNIDVPTRVVFAHDWGVERAIARRVGGMYRALPESP